MASVKLKLARALASLDEADRAEVVEIADELAGMRGPKLNSGTAAPKPAPKKRGPKPGSKRKAKVAAAPQVEPEAEADTGDDDEI